MCHSAFQAKGVRIYFSDHVHSHRSIRGSSLTATMVLTFASRPVDVSGDQADLIVYAASLSAS